ncbi:DNA-methyltransferase [Herbaspirillum camelliae]|uniref:DNA-methyltransferase n=1 Tax=Herbaspirillum camelliae TaxID=1892903 RepID=UPI000949C81D|nr:site-specific DNA-methyltransferase [Herbaspirillum camelliae]
MTQIRTKKSKVAKALTSESLSELSYTVFAGDARDLVQELLPKSVQSVVTSPPYWGLRSYGAESEIGAEATIDEYLDAVSAVFNAVKEVLCDDGVVWLVIGDSYTSGNRRYRDADRLHVHREMTTRPKTPKGLKPKDLLGLPWRVAFRLQADGWYLRSESIWHKLNPIPESVKDRPHQSHEHIFLLSKSAKYFFDWNALKQYDSQRLRPSRSVWAASVNTGISGHAAPFPLELVKPCLMASTRPGDLVLDPFAGSGSVGVACKELDRSFVGIELITKNVLLAETRINQAVSHQMQFPEPVATSPAPRRRKAERAVGVME